MAAEFIPIFAIIGGVLIALIAIVSGTIKSISHRKQVEMSRREIAAYIAEGTMSPADGKALLESAPIKED